MHNVSPEIYHALNEALADDEAAKRIGEAIAAEFHLLKTGDRYMAANGNKTAISVARTVARIMVGDW